MIISSLTIYSFDGESRTIRFRESGLNIITGKSKTGKSSIIDIIDYCLGRGECYIADGVIRQFVSWFGLHLKNGSDQIFIARRNPPRNRTTDPDVFIRRGVIDDIPNYPDLRSNIPVNELERLVTRFAGISENEHRPETGSRRPLKANISHALFLCFQKQDEIASRERLFHRQGDPFIPQAIKDTLPYFLGAVDQEFFLWQRELDVAQSELRALEAQRDSLAVSTQRALSKARQFLADGKRVGLVEDTFDTSDPQIALDRLVQVSQTSAIADPSLPQGQDLISSLRDELQSLRSSLSDVQNDVRATRHFFFEQSAFSREVTEQRDRLASIELYKDGACEDTLCPLCENKLSTRVPAATDLANALEQLNRQLNAVTNESPHLQTRLSELNEKQSELQSNIVQAQRAINQAYIEDEKARSLRDLAIDRAKVIGRISAFIEQTSSVNESADLEKRIEDARRKVSVLAERVNSEEVADRVQSTLNLISDKMTEYAADLNLEHTGGRIRLDIKKLTVIADTNTGPVQLNRMGSGENWVGYHVATLLALHYWFRTTDRPVPGFMIFDQPTQAHYPPEADRDGRVDELLDEDRRAVRNLFETMADVATEIGSGFQLIVLDHAHLDDSWFEEAIIEEWRGADALVPLSWVDSAR
ncbi:MULTISPECIES: DUF3732 domain-containing protein [unclassified Hyphomonas]|uniref:DUF3732 domain-containing protein n=1 Tax=unclassified Hyphomonas TaxID=2630699 RepID=UPI0009DEAA55|nr:MULTISPECIES: DUF3732 domain-containing protein [unclassified Hyphomonas]